MGKNQLSSSTVAKILVHIVEPNLRTPASGPTFYNMILGLIDKQVISRADLPDKLFRWIYFKAGHDSKAYAEKLEKKLLKE